MTTSTTTSKGLSLAEMKILSDFSNTVTARQYNEGVVIEKLVMSYDKVNGFNIELVEAPPTQDTVTE